MFVNKCETFKGYNNILNVRLHAHRSKRIYQLHIVDAYVPVKLCLIDKRIESYATSISINRVQ